MMGKLNAILFDLDNTILTNDMEIFVPAYLKLISGYAAELYDPKRFVEEMLAATEVMATNTDPAVSNETAFWNEFSRLTGWNRDKMIPFFSRFYENEFDILRQLTRPRPEARPLVEWAFDNGYQVVIATNPMFPRIATEKRLTWAGLGVEEFDYALVTTYENMHATKPHCEYYLEILAHVGCAPAQALMVGDDLTLDIEPAGTVGMRTYWVDPQEDHGGSSDWGQGPLSALRSWLEAH
jgi:HAD superfamily hydrolase (TIGR01549 family)